MIKVRTSIPGGGAKLISGAQGHAMTKKEAVAKARRSIRVGHRIIVKRPTKPPWDKLTKGTPLYLIYIADNGDF